MTSPLTELQAAILNLPCKVPAEFSDDEAFILKIGFNEARQKAASLASAHASQVEALRVSHAELLSALEDLFGADMEHCMRGDGKDDQLAAIARARTALANAKLAEQPNSFHLAASPSERTLDQQPTGEAHGNSHD